MLDTMWQDVRYALRSLTRRPVVTAVAVLSLALGIGVNTAIFSVFERMLLRRLPVPAPEQIVQITSPGPRPGWTSTDNSGGPDHIFSYPLFRDLERLEDTGLLQLAGHRDFAANLSYRGETTREGGLLVSGGYFPALGLAPAAGRLLNQDDDRVPGGHPLVVLAHQYWITRFGANPRVVGEGVIVNGQPMTIIGVAAAGFVSTTAMEAPRLFVPLAMRDQMRAGTDRRNDHWLYAFGRLKPGVTRDQAQALINVLFDGIIRDVEFPIQRSGLGDRGREAFLARRIVLEPGARFREADRDEIRLMFVLLLAVTGVVLLIACANLANLMLARATERLGEIGIRLSVGASARRVIRMLMTEAFLLGLLGSVGALAVAHLTVTSLLAIMPAEDAALLPFELNGPILLFTLGLGLGTTVLFGLLPALHALRAAVGGGATAQTRASDTRSTTRFRTTLATVQIALATTLLVQAGLFLTSLLNVARVELGIQREGLVAFRVSPYLNGYGPDRALALFERIEEALRGVPGVISTTASTLPLLADTSSTRNVTVEGFEAGPEDDTTVGFAQTGAEYFRTLGIPILAGREFTRADAANAPKVAIVNEAFTRKFNLGARPVGSRLALGAGGDNVLDTEIIGLVRDAKYSQVTEAAPPQLFVPYRQGGFEELTFYVRSSSDVRPLLSAVPAVLRRLDPNLPVERLRTMDDQIWDNTTRDRVLTTLSASFAGLATLLAGIGLYAVLAYTVAQRRREIGVRMALGADSIRIANLVLGHVTRVGVVGALVGCAAALALGRLAESFLFGVSGAQPGVMVGAVVGVAIVTVVAAVLPASRAVRVDPAVALRAE
jgi:predicted permease